MLRIVAVETIHVLPGWQASRRIVINPPLGAYMDTSGVLLLDAGRTSGGGRHLFVPWANIRNVELDAEDEEETEEAEETVGGG